MGRSQSKLSRLLGSSDSLFDGTSRYKVERCLGTGTYGVVVQCRKTGTKEKIAIKLVESCSDEMSVLKMIRELEKKTNIVKFIDHFTCKGLYCLAFEKLDMDLFDLMFKRMFLPLKVCQIRVIAQQMLVALDALKTVNVAHTDIKINNIMLVDHKLYPFKVKLIDFGKACQVTSLELGRTIQNLGYRAPEVYLGLPINEGIDMWGLACVLAYLYIGGVETLHPQTSEYEAMRVITQMHGQLDDQTLSSGRYTDKYFTMDSHSSTASWRLYTRDEHKARTRDRTGPVDGNPATSMSLEAHFEFECGTRYEMDNDAFLSLLRQMLQVDPNKRISPSEALSHPFITMEHFKGHTDKAYVKRAFSTFKGAGVDSTAESNDGPTASRDVDEATAAGSNEILPDRSEPNTATDRRGKGPGEGKRWRKWFSNLAKWFCCKNVDVIE